MKKHIFRKSQVEKGLGLKASLYETYGKGSQEIMVSEEQLNRLLEKCGGGRYEEQMTPPATYLTQDSEDFTTSMLDEVEDELELDEFFDDFESVDHEDHISTKQIVPQEQNFEEGFNYEKGEFNPGDGANDESYDGHHFKHDVIGAYDDDLTGKSRRGEVYEDSEGEETYNYDEDIYHDKGELEDLKRHHDDLHAADLEKDMDYDEKRGVGKDDKWRKEAGTDFRNESVEGLLWKRDLAKVNFLVAETYESIRKSILKERVSGLDRRNYILKPGMLSESQDEWRGHNPGASAAAGIENIIDNIKKAWHFLKDGKTRKQIENTLVKLDNFMTYTAELIGSGEKQSKARGYDKIARPLPHPNLDEPEELEDIDDEITISEMWDEDLELE